MAHTYEQLAEKKRGLERAARERPLLYRLRVGLLAALGYAYVLLLLVLAVTGLVLLVPLLADWPARGGIGVPLAVIALVLISFALLRALLFRWPAPEGIRLDRRAAPLLFERIERIRTRLKADPVHDVILIGALNAGMEQVPRLAVLGPYRNRLHIGLPLMEALTTAQLEAIIAHEIGHLSRRHSRFAAWIYRVRATWDRLIHIALMEGTWGSWLLLVFARWYVPLFDIYSLALSQIHEFDADRSAAEWAGSDRLAETLLRFSIFWAHAEERCGPALYRLAADRPRPPDDLLSRLGAGCFERLEADDARRFLADALLIPAEPLDSHPSLAERLAAIGRLPEPDAIETAELLNGDLEASAAQALLGESLGEIRDQLALKVQAAASAEWAHLHAQHTVWRADARRAQGGPNRSVTIDDLWDEAWKTEESISRDHALRLYARFLGRWPDHPGANLRFGALLGERDHPAADAHLELACRSDPEVIADALAVRAQLARRRGAAEEAAGFHLRLLENRSALERFQEAANDIAHPSTGFQPHGLDGARLDRLGERLAGFDTLTGAYLARREFEDFPDAIVYLLSVETSFSIGEIADHSLEAIAVAAGLAFPLTVREHSRLPRRVRRRIETTNASLVYER